jgi:hypothetical protein
VEEAVRKDRVLKPRHHFFEAGAKAVDWQFKTTLANAPFTAVDCP